MNKHIETKLRGMLWDYPSVMRENIFCQIVSIPYEALQDEQLLLRTLNSLDWYDLIELLGPDALDGLLKDNIINKLYPVKRRDFYRNAKRLLSKYSLFTPG